MISSGGKHLYSTKKGRSLEEIFKRYEFNRTEPETLASLVGESIKAGDGVKDELKRFREITEKLLNVLDLKAIVRLDPLKIDGLDDYKGVCAAGIDGSLQPVEGFGGYWFVPTSCATVILRNGPSSEPEVVVSAAIEKIKEYEDYNVWGEAIFRMMTVESKAIMNWAEKHDPSCRSALFIDGPIVDPPACLDKNYVKYRCDAIKRCLEKDILVIGCVKRMKAKYLIEFVSKNLLKTDTDKKLIANFAWDSQFVTSILSKLAIQSPEMILATIPVDISEIDNTYQAYRNEGIIIHSSYLQKDATANPLRLDFPTLKGSETDITQLAAKIWKTVYAWSYPGIDIPLPVFLAHNKCEVRKGCAEVLYNEIITRSASSDFFENFMNEKLKR